MKEKSRIFKKIASLSESGKEFAVVTVVSASEGTPRKSGSRMVVYADGSTDFTVGGGSLEEIARKKAIEALKKGNDTTVNAELNLEGNTGMVCGGEAELYIEIFKSEEEIVIFGGGHIGVALSKFLDILGIGYRIFDDRKNFLNEQRFPNAIELNHIQYGEKLADKYGIDSKSYCVIVTHGHKGDKEVLRELLKTEAPYIGMIGSKTKVKAVLDMLKGDKVDMGKYRERVYTPIGLDIGGDSPEEIAVSIISEIFMVKNGGTGQPIRDKVGKK